jgi:hypothetical protein
VTSFLHSDSNSQQQATKKLRDHSIAMFVEKYSVSSKKFENMSEVMPKLQFMNATVVENLINGSMLLRDTSLGTCMEKNLD